MSDKKYITENIRIDNAEFTFRTNFSGRISEFNRDGQRNFCVSLDDKLAEDLLRDGWKVKYRKPNPNDPDQYAQPFLQVRVSFDNEKYIPKVYMVTKRGKKLLNEFTIGQLDDANILNVDLSIRPHNYPAMPNRPAGVSAYLKSMYVTIAEDPLDEKYAEVTDLDEIEHMNPPYDI